MNSYLITVTWLAIYPPLLWEDAHDALPAVKYARSDALVTTNSSSKFVYRHPWRAARETVFTSKGEFLMGLHGRKLDSIIQCNRGYVLAFMM